MRLLIFIALVALSANAAEDEARPKSELPDFEIETGPSGNFDVSDFRMLHLTDCKQSSEYKESMACNRAFDGELSQNQENKPGAMVNNSNGWWSAKTYEFSHIKAVRIYNRQDCCTESLNDFDILVDDVKCAVYVSDTSFSVKTFKCDTYGQVIKIQSRKEYLTLIEVQVFGDGVLLPLNSCSQSSDGKSTSTCDKAYDSNTNQLLETSQSCSLVGKENGWWKASTTEGSSIFEVRIFNRLDCCWDNLGDFDIYINEHKCARYQSNEAFAERSFKCKAKGNRIKIVSRKPRLALCEVQVFGVQPLRSLQLSNCRQSSTFSTYSCEYAYDRLVGDGKRCAHLDNAPGWWRAEFIGQAVVRKVFIVHRNDCCQERLNDFTISVDSKVCHTHKSTAKFYEKVFPCNGFGRDITIASNLPYLTLCEIDVFGYYPKI